MRHLHADLRVPEDTGSLRGDFAAVAAQAVTAGGRTDTLTFMPRMLAEASGEPELHAIFTECLVEPRRRVLAEVLERARARGELRAGRGHRGGHRPAGRPDDLPAADRRDGPAGARPPRRRDRAGRDRRPQASLTATRPSRTCSVRSPAQQRQQLVADELAPPALQRAHGRRLEAAADGDDDRATGRRGRRSARRPGRPPARGRARSDSASAITGPSPGFGAEPLLRRPGGSARRAGRARSPRRCRSPRRRMTSGRDAADRPSAARSRGWRLASSTTDGSRRMAPTGRSSRSAVRSRHAASSRATARSRGSSPTRGAAAARPRRHRARRSTPRSRRHSSRAHSSRPRSRSRPWRSSVERQQMLDVLAGVAQLLGRQRPLVPAREAGRLGQPDAQHVVQQPEVAGLGREAGEPGGDLGVEHARDVGAPLPAQQRHVLAAGVQDHLDRGSASTSASGAGSKPAPSERVQQRDLVADDDLHEAQQRPVAALGHELGVDAEPPFGSGALGEGGGVGRRPSARTLPVRGPRAAVALRCPPRRERAHDAEDPGPAVGHRRGLPRAGGAHHPHAHRRVDLLDGPPPPLEDFLAHVRSRLHLVPRYRQKLAFPPLEAGLPLWVDDPTFNLEYHVRHTALPAPGRRGRRCCGSRRGSSPSSWTGPSRCGSCGWWRACEAERPAFALISKTHHALVDGVSGADLATVLFDVPPEGTALPPGAAVGPAPRADAAPSSSPAACTAPCGGWPASRPPRCAGRRTRAGCRPARGRSPRASARSRWAALNPPSPTAVQRRARPAPAPGRRPRRAGRVQGGQGRRSAGPSTTSCSTVAAGGLAHFLRAARRSTTDGLGLRALRPGVRARARAAAALGNEITIMMAPLPVDVADPVERLAACAR